MARGHTLETLQAQYADFCRRAEPGLTQSDLCARLHGAIEHLEAFPDALKGASQSMLLGEMLIDLCCLAEQERLDLAHHARQAFKAMQAEYEANQ
jgi:hypothetical protein